MVIREAEHRYGAADITCLDPINDLEPSELELYTIGFSCEKG